MSSGPHTPPASDGSAGALVLVAVAAPHDRPRPPRRSSTSSGAAHGLAWSTTTPSCPPRSIRHSRDMRNNAFSSHTGSDGSTIGQRAQAGYPAVKFGEIIGYAVGAPGSVWTDRDMVNWVMSSPGHRAHVLDPAYTEFGSTMASGR